MNVNRRTQGERTAATRAALVDAGRTLFGQHGYAHVGTSAVVEAAGVTRGALYHQFSDKLGLFRAVVEAEETELVAAIAERVVGAGETDAVTAMRRGVRVFLDVLADPAVRQILLSDAPSVLGWVEWRAIGQQAALGLVEGLLQAGVDQGLIVDQPLHPVAIVFIGAVDEAALHVATADDPVRAREEVLVVVDRILDAFLVPGAVRSS